MRILSLIALFGFVSLAHAAKPVTPPPYEQFQQLKPGEKDPSAIYAKNTVYSLESYKMVYRAQVELASAQFIKNDPILRDSSNMAKDFTDGQNQKVDAYLNGESIKGGWLQAIAKDASNSALGAATKGTISAPNTVDKIVDSIIESNSTSGTLPDFLPSIEQQSATLFYMANYPGLPGHEWALQTVRRSYPTFIPGSLDFRPEVRDQLNKDSVNSDLGDLQKKLKDLAANKDKLTPEQIKQGIGEAMKPLIVEATNAMGDELKRQQDKIADLNNRQQFDADSEVKVDWNELKQKRAEFDRMSRNLRTLSKGYYLFTRDASTSEAIGKLAGFVEVGREMYTVNRTKLLSESPGAYTNVYVAFAALAVDLLASPSPNAERESAQATASALRAISLQIESLREQMHELFERQKAYTAIYFDHAFINLQNLKISADLLHGTVENMRLESRRALGRIQTQLNDEWLLQLTDLQTLCLSKKSEAFFKNQPDLPIRCRNQLAQMAQAESAGISLINDSSLQKLERSFQKSMEWFSELRQLMVTTKSDVFLGEVKGNPASWLFFAKQFVQFFKIHPSQRSEAAVSSIDGRDDLSLANLISLGEQHKENISHLALIPEGSHFRLNRTLFNGLLEIYSQEVDAAIAAGKSAIGLAENGVPNPYLGGNSGYIQDSKYAFLNQPIGFCDAKNGKVDVGVMKPGNSYTYAPYLVEQTPFLTRLLQRINPNDMTLDESFLKYISPEILNAVRTGFNNAEIIPCFRSITYSNILVGVDSAPGILYKSLTRLHFDLQLIIDFYLATGVGQGRQMFLANSVTVGGSMEASGFDSLIQMVIQFNKNNFVMLTNFWKGKSNCSSCMLPLQGVYGHGSEPGNLVIESVAANVDQSAFQIFVNDFRNGQKYDAQNAKEKALSALDKTGQLSASDALKMIVSLGINPNSTAVADFVKWLGQSDTLPDASEIGRRALESKMTSAQIRSMIKVQVARAQKYIDAIEKQQNLVPPTFAIDNVLRDLHSLEKQDSWLPSVFSWKYWFN